MSLNKNSKGKEIKTDFKVNEIYIIEWRDHFETGDGNCEDCVMESIGFFVRSNEHFSFFARTLVDNDEPHHVLAIITKEILKTNPINRT